MSGCNGQYFEHSITDSTLTFDGVNGVEHEAKQPHPYWSCAQLAPQNAPQISSRAVVSCRFVSSLFLVKVFCSHFTLSGEKRINTFTRLRSRVRVPQRPLLYGLNNAIIEATTSDPYDPQSHMAGVENFLGQ